MFEEKLEDVAQITNEIDYNDAWAIDMKATDDLEFRKKVRAVLAEYDDAIAEGDQDGMDAAGRKLKELAKECA